MIRPLLPQPSQLQELKKKGLMLLSAFAAALSHEMESPADSAESVRDPCETAIYAVLNMEFVGPDEDMVRIDQRISNNKQQDEVDGYGAAEDIYYMNGDVELEEYYAHAAEVYEPYLSDKGIENFVHTEWQNALRLHRANLDYRMTPSHWSLEQAEIDGNASGIRAYDFYVLVDYQAASEELENYNFHGWAICTPAGEITHLKIIDSDHLGDRLDADVQK